MPKKTKEQNKSVRPTEDTPNEQAAGAGSLPDATSSNTSVSSQEEKKFTAADYNQLSENENFRYAKNSTQVAHAVLTRNQQGEKIALQYNLPQGEGNKGPSLCQLEKIEEIERYGRARYQAIGPNGKKWYAKRYDHARARLQDDADSVSVDLAYFSEEEVPGKEPFWGSSKEVPRYRKDFTDEQKKDWAAETAEIATLVKGGHELRVDPQSVRERDVNRKRKPDQNTVMGESARDAYENFFSEMQDELSPELRFILKRAFKANLRKTPENQYRPEWLHLYGFSLTPSSENPQHQGNLGAAAKWANTEMMVLERIAKWFSMNKEKSTRITIKSLFDMLRDSELVDKIHFEVNIEMKNRFVRFIQELDAFQKYPVFRKASDLAQATGITYAISCRYP